MLARTGHQREAGDRIAVPCLLFRRGRAEATITSLGVLPAVLGQLFVQLALLAFVREAENHGEGISNPRFADLQKSAGGGFGALLSFSLAFGPAAAAYADNAPSNGTWDEKETVLNKDAAAAAATVTPAKAVAPAGFQFNQGANLETFLIYHLSQTEDATLPSDGASGPFNERFGTDWYITAAIDRTGADK